MRVLVADKFEQSGLDGLRAAGCDVIFQPDLKDASLREAITSAQADVLVVRGTAGESWLNFDTPGFSIQGQGWGFAGSAYLGGRWLLFDDGARDAALAEAIDQIYQGSTVKQ